LHQLADNTLGISGKTDYFLIGTQTGIVDEDEAIVSGDDLAEEQENGHLHSLCLLCGTIALGNRQHCNCGGSMMPLCWMELKKEQEPTHCINCGARSTNPLIFRFLTGQDAPVSVLATALYQQLPPSLDPDVAELPGQGRKLLIFSDSRQDAAFFAPYLERTYNQVLHRRLILIAVLGDKDGLAGHLRL